MCSKVLLLITLFHIITFALGCLNHKPFSANKTEYEGPSIGEPVSIGENDTIVSPGNTQDQQSNTDTLPENSQDQQSNTDTLPENSQDQQSNTDTLPENSQDQQTDPIEGELQDNSMVGALPEDSTNTNGDILIDIGNLSSQFVAPKFSVFKGSSFYQLEEYLDYLNNSSKTQVESELYYKAYEIILDENFESIQFKYETSKIINTSGGYKYTSEGSEKCNITFALNSESRLGIKESYLNLRYCMGEKTSSEIGLSLPEGLDALLGHSGFHQMNFYTENGATEHIDFLGAYYSGYKHYFICGDKKAFIDDLKKVHDLNSISEKCPQPEPQSDPLISNYGTF